MLATNALAESRVFRGRKRHREALFILIVALAAFIASDRYFSFLEDETYIVNAARQPVAETVALFWSGQGQHEHPPLSDLLLHFWLPIGGSAPWLLRLPSVLFYLAGLLLYAQSAQLVGGPSAFSAVLYLGCLWPFAFHFARMTGWYSFCFFLAAAITLAYFWYLEEPGWGRLAVFIGTALLILYSNYYGWALVGCFAIDVCFRKRKVALKFIFCTFAVLFLAYMPMWAAFFNELSSRTPINEVPSAARIFLNSVYCFYSLFISESVAPWFWPLSLPASIAILLSIIATLVLLPKQHRVFIVYFGLLFVGMTAIGIVGTRRLLFISGWLLLSFSIALGNRKMKALRTLLMLSLVVVSLVGWTGIFAKKWYAAPHFIEPWAEIADEAATGVGQGQIVVSNSPAFLFYANYALRDHALLTSSFHPGSVRDPRITAIFADSRVPALHTIVPTTPSNVLFVNGVNHGAIEDTERIESWLRSNCSLVSMRQLVPDSGYALKSRYFEGSAQPQYRIALENFRCIRP